MSLRLQISLIVMTSLSIGYVVAMIKKENLDLKYSLTWLAMGICMFLLAVIPRSIQTFSRLLGIEDPMNALFFASSILQMVITFSLTIAASRSSERVKKLTQELAMFQNEIKKD